MDFFSQKTYETRSDLALAWLKRSIEKCDGQGSSHSFSPFFGWSAAYPETTGYLIETLFDFSKLKKDPSLAVLAKNQALWLAQIQRPDGSWQSSTVDKKNAPSSFFNTGQILFGISRAAVEWPEKRDFFIEKAEKAAIWMAENIENDGSCHDFLYVKNRSATYHTRAIWGLLAANELLKNAEIEAAARRAMAYYSKKWTENDEFLDAAFFEKKAAPTHTIAYAIRGFLECGLLLKDEKLIEIASASMKKLLLEQKKAGRTAGAYFKNWQPDLSFRCLTGQFQLSLTCSRLYETTDDDQFLAAAEMFFEEGAPFQNLSKNENRRGAFAGSAPIWGSYLRFRYPNWAVKFFLDAYAKLLF